MEYICNGEVPFVDAFIKCINMIMSERRVEENEHVSKEVTTLYRSIPKQLSFLNLKLHKRRSRKW